MINYSLEVSKPGKLTSNRTEIPFQIPLKAKQIVRHLYETYHGVFINIQVLYQLSFYNCLAWISFLKLDLEILKYMIKVEMKRSVFNKDVAKQMEITIITKVFVLHVYIADFIFFIKLILSSNPSLTVSWPRRQ
jgi:hypothetical protein